MDDGAAIQVWRRAFVISGRTARRIVEAPAGPLELSLDLGRSRAAVTVEGGSAVLPDGRPVGIDVLSQAVSDDEDCVELAASGPRKVYLYSEERRKYYKLYQPFEDRPPTVVINGATMHAIVGKDPWQDEVEKVAQVPARRGACLDTCCGLGYSAQLLLSAGFRPVVTCEADPNVLVVAAVNPWSEGLWAPHVVLVPMDLRDLVRSTPDGRFACVFHDPPTVHQAGELYSEELYRGFARVLAPGGVLYHYVGAPGRRAGRDYARGVMRRLQAAGFVDVRRAASGVAARRAR
jgi:predicted methyltransferase